MSPLLDSISTDRTLDSGALLGRFLEVVEGRKMQLYPAQEEAMLEIFDDKNVILNTPTGSGKSLVATALHAQSSQWQLTWSDEFNAANGSPPDSVKWNTVTGGEGFGNNEQEIYTSRAANVQQQNGKLVITARKEDLTGPGGIPRHYTSARLNTQNRFSQKYGRFEARMQLPTGKGIWPAF